MWTLIESKNVRRNKLWTLQTFHLSIFPVLSIVNNDWKHKWEWKMIESIKVSNIESIKVTCPSFPFWALWTSSGKHWARVASCGISPFRLKLWFMLNFSSLCLFVLYLYFDYCEHCLADIERVLPVMVFHLLCWNYYVLLNITWILGNNFERIYECIFKYFLLIW